MASQKQCSKCKLIKPEYDFSEGRALCNKCIEYKRRYRENHQEELRQAQKEYYEKNREKDIERAKRYKNDNKNIIRETNKQYRENHKEEIQQKKKEYYENNKEKIQEKQKEYNVKIECTICKCMIGKYRIKIHEQSIKHQMNANGHYLI